MNHFWARFQALFQSVGIIVPQPTYSASAKLRISHHITSKTRKDDFISLALEPVLDFNYSSSQVFLSPPRHTSSPIDILARVCFFAHLLEEFVRRHYNNASITRMPSSASTSCGVRWITRLVPCFLLAIVIYATYVVVARICGMFQCTLGRARVWRLFFLLQSSLVFSGYQHS